MSPRPFQGSTKQTSPTAARPMPRPCRIDGRSPSSHQANSTTQNGMVYAISDTLPTPPDTSAVCTNPWNPAVCVNPISSVSFHGGIASGRRVAIARANSTLLPVT
ncbi:hypothetical protein G6F68_021075 [Rhizopus microsporus]|nr:hypothetical protein G6F68_021075 [Rhizopus microsporus]